ncbi:MAG: adenylate/guanylate cyclase domain-containing protein [Hydrogenophaga sp.]|uniref:CHASE2 domain-containing protein n=1 Tax=Hydrogenophaga sp. TaxID=1904254 RepID=UPI00275FC051|nr:adenylate/guanylate cyclase domain-containing protein [Hydrogenophaga sp.]MDP2416965.1 adenylate/guanylate cyclase domain-containing protein [Hydrogenophaga sp.]MDZ4188461.1 adenylate/guanylate cyclase domain-containing protein [Hydrogenophaga sp.]
MVSKRPLVKLGIALLPVLLAVLHVTSIWRIGPLEWVDDLIYDTRLRATMPETLDERIVIVDIDEKSLAEVGQWPWPRDKLAAITHHLFDEQRIAVLGFDVVFAEPDVSSGLLRLEQLAGRELAHISEFTSQVKELAATLDHDRLFANAIANRPVILGHYFTSDRDGRTSGQLPAPVMEKETFGRLQSGLIGWTGYGANLPILMKSASDGGYFNAITDSDGVVRAIPLVSEFEGVYYQSLSLAVYRALLGQSTVEPGFPSSRFLPRGYDELVSIVIREDGNTVALPVDYRGGSLIPYRGRGGPQGGSFAYVSASDVLHSRLAPGMLKGKVVLFGTTAPGLLDLRTTPVGPAYPGVEAHANLISGFLDGNTLVIPDYALGYELVVIVICGLLLTLLLPRLSAPKAMVLSLIMIAVVSGLNLWLYTQHGLVLPLAASIFMVVAAFVFNMSYGYFSESRSKRELAQLFGTYVPPELVQEMVKDPDRYTMQARSCELTVMFCDMRGFTHLSEGLTPEQLQALLNRLFSRLTRVIRKHRGTIDKYMGDCVMAFWGAPIQSADHAKQAVLAALDMILALAEINQEFIKKGWPQIGIGIGLNTGPMFVGDMGSDLRRSYTVIGDAVNLGSRLEALSRIYGVDIVVGESVRRLASGFHWQELDRVVVKGKVESVAIYTPRQITGVQTDADLNLELSEWASFLRAYRHQNWDACDTTLLNLKRLNSDYALYQFYTNRVSERRHLPFDPTWDGSTHFQSK